MKTAVVTGGSRGIGAAAVREFCDKNWAVALLYYKNSEKAQSLEHEMRALGRECVAVCANVSDSSQVEEAFEKVVSMWGHIDSLVCCAGIAAQQLFDSVTDADWSDMLSVNLTGTFNCCRSAVKRMLKTKSGSIITVASMWGEHGGSCETAYSATKGGVIGLTKALAAEVAPSGIRVNCVSPGAINTDMLSSFSERDLASLCEEIPLGRIGEPREVASVIEFLASDSSSYITGQVFAVNGGMFR